MIPRVAILMVASAVCGVGWDDLVWMLMGPGPTSALISLAGGIVIGAVVTSLGFRRRRPEERCSACHGDVRLECITWGVCQLGPDAVVRVPPPERNHDAP